MSKVQHKSQPPSSASRLSKRDKAPGALPPAPVLFRDAELLLLTNLVDSSSLRSPVYVSGLSGSGKSFLLESIQARSDHIPFAYVDCMLLQTEAEVVSRIISEIRPFYADAEDGLDEKKMAKSSRTVGEIRRLVSQQPGTVDDREMPMRTVIVLDGIEHLKKAVDLLSKLMLMQLADSIAITLIFVGRYPWTSFTFSSSGLGDVLEIHLESYTKKELFELVYQIFDLTDGKEDMVALAKSFCRLIVETFHPVTKNIQFLRAQAQKHSGAFFTPIREGRLKPHQSDLLFRNFMPIIAAEIQGRSAPVEVKKPQSTAMPPYLRYLLVAAYLCSFNPSQADARMVAKRHERVRKEKEPTARKKVKDKRLTVLGPQAFSFERLGCNFLSLTADHNVKLCMLQIQANLRTLCDMKLVVRVGSEENLDNPKFKCISEKRCVQQIASSIDLDLNRYLIDLV